MVAVSPQQDPLIQELMGRPDLSKAEASLLALATQEPNDHEGDWTIQHVWRRWLQENPGSKSRKEVELSELARLRSLWIAAGGDYIYEEDSPKLPEIFEHLKEGGPLVLGAQDLVLRSPLWSDVRMNDLNDFENHFYGASGQVRLFVLLAIATGNLKLSISNSKKFWGDGKDDIYKEREWKNVLKDWRYSATLLKHVNWDNYKGQAGRKSFADEYFKGDTAMARHFVGSILDKAAFEALGWIPTRQSRYQAAPLKTETKSHNEEPKQTGTHHQLPDDEPTDKPSRLFKGPRRRLAFDRFDPFFDGLSLGGKVRGIRGPAAMSLGLLIKK